MGGLLSKTPFYASRRQHDEMPVFCHPVDETMEARSMVEGIGTELDR
jgi:hypothetical protein